MKVGDIVTQSDEFFEHWTCDIFYAKVLHIEENVVHLDKDVTISKVNNFMMPVDASDFHMKFLKVDISKTRLEKMKQLNCIQNE
jgi:hypothetical protein